jgi:para-aminobenzoate synthetase component 1
MNNPNSNILQKALQWANQFDVCCLLNSNGYTENYGAYDCLVAVGTRAEISANSGQAFEQLATFHKNNPGWLFGLFGYDLKNEIENLDTLQPNHLGFPDLYFFAPKYLLAIKNNNIEVLIGDKCIIKEINRLKVDSKTQQENLTIETKFTKESYFSTTEKLKQHIKRGDVYEVNFCQEFFAKNAIIDPLAVYNSLNHLSPTPFSGYFKIYDSYILSATPERFLCKRGNKLISQPIKGTAKRSKNSDEDELLKHELKTSEKERAENVMIVDLVRNDLTKSAIAGSVKVEELFGIYSFPQVHQMISTITCELNPEISEIEAIKNTFPMGSMTGAPKIKAMQLIDQYELSRRGAYSGSFGCISPNGDFDFNVIIRSILYNKKNQYLSFQVGSAITYQSDLEKEYEECLVKAEAMLKVLKVKV